MNDLLHYCQHVTRRHFLRDCGVGLGKIALAGLLTESLAPGALATASVNPLAPRKPHFQPKAKRVIHLFMAGAPSQLDLFDYKPELAKYAGKPLPPSVIGGQRYAFIRPDANVLGPQFKFARHGQCGAEISEVLPHLAEIVDDICLIKSVNTTQFNHAPAQLFFQTGFQQPGRPCLGSWTLYGLGSETQELPAFAVMSTGAGLSGGAALYSSGFLPTLYSGVRLRTQGDPVLDVSSQSAADGDRWRPGDFHAAGQLRDGVQAADVGAGINGVEERAPGDAEALWLRSRQAVLCPGLSARPADDRARGAFREYLP
jgi:hypothetical protein